MMHSLNTSTTGMLAQQLNIDVISNNIANVNTTGYKRSRVEFQDLLYQTCRLAGSPMINGMVTPVGIQLGLGTKPSAIFKLFQQGDFQQTENPLDLVIEGDGFFQIQLPDGTMAYTRDGSFKKDGQGRLVTSDGYLLFPEIVVPQNATQVTVGADGIVSAQIKGSSTQQYLGQIILSNFVNPAGLEALGKNLFLANDASGQPQTAPPGTEGLGYLEQGYLEMSNVRVVEEMVNMIKAQRAYEADSKVIQASDEMLDKAVNIRR
ncbi:MAG: flagellar basal-body rod protein FlgG [bacterium]